MTRQLLHFCAVAAATAAVAAAAKPLGRQKAEYYTSNDDICECECRTSANIPTNSLVIL